MLRFPWRFLLISLFTAWLFDYLFWQKPAGISFLLLVGVVLLGAFLLSAGEQVRFSKNNIPLLSAALLTAFMVFLRQEPLTMAVNALLAVVLTGLLLATFRHGYWMQFRLVDYIVTAFHAVIACLSRPFDLSARQQPEETGGVTLKTLARRALPILRGVILALPVVIVLGILLASADPIFSDWMQDWLKIFDLERLGEYLFRFFYILVLTYLLVGLFLHAIHPRREASQPDPQQPWIKGFLGTTESIVVLVSVNLLFAIFLFVQLRYFFGGQANISETGYTYSEYARRGFGELLAVSLLSLLLHLGLGVITRQTGRAAKTTITVVSVLLIAQVLVILGSAFQRLLLYEHAYGFTRLRSYAHVFMLWLGVLLLATAAFEIARARGRFALALLGCAVGFGLTLGFINVDGLVVRQNVQRTGVGGELDAGYLNSLSSDATPALLQQFSEADQPAEVRDRLGAVLACQAVLLQEQQTDRPWQAFSWSRARALKLLEQRQDELEDYPLLVVDGEWAVSLAGEVTTCRAFPSGEQP